MSDQAALVAALRAGLAEHANPANAAAMGAYMQSTPPPFLGLKMPLVQQVCRRVFAQHRLEGCDAWRDAVLRLWREAQHREERYAAIALAQARRYAACQTLEALPVYQEMIVTGAWWDLVDGIASHSIGELLRRYPVPVRQTMLDWSRGPDLWLRRTSIICQLTFQQHTDADLLYACIEPNLAERDFFLRKAIGWALRQYARTDPEAVRRYVAATESRLSPLSRREATKHL